GTVNGHSPFLTEQQKYGRDKRTRVTDTYPPYEVGNIPGPTYSTVKTPDPNSGRYSINDTTQPPKKSDKRNGENYPPLFIGPSFNRRCHINSHIVIGFIPGY